MMIHQLARQSQYKINLLYAKQYKQDYDIRTMMFVFLSMSITITIVGAILIFLGRSRVLIPHDWPVVRMLPALVANANRHHDFFNSILLCQPRSTFVIEGPWLTGLRFVLTCNSANAKHMYNSHFSNYPKGEEFADMLDVLGKGIITSDGALWAKHRKMANAVIRSHQFRSSTARYTKEKLETAALPILDKRAWDGQILDLQEFFKRLSVDVTRQLVLGKDPCSLAEDFPSIEFADAVDVANEVIAYRHFVPGFWWRMLRRLRFGEEKKMADAKDVIDKFIVACIEEKKEDDSVLASYMHHSQEQDHVDATVDRQDIWSYFVSDRFIRDTSLTFLSAATDTTSAALTWFFWLLVTHPNVEKKILNELNKIPNSPVIFDIKDTEGLVYLHAALCESLRLYPPVPFNHKIAHADDVLPSGDRVSKGTMVIFSTYSIGRMKSVWGEDCVEFKPERWIDESNGKLKHIRDYEFLVFHSGPRACPGKNMALTQMKIIAPTLVFNYHFEVDPNCNVKPNLSVVLGMKHGLMIKALRKRTN